MAVRHLSFSLAAALALLPVDLPAAPYLVKDLNTAPPLILGQIPFEERGLLPGVSYFSAPDPAHGIELWRSDGTPGGTFRLTDICTGRCDAMPSAITVHAGKIFFNAADGFSGFELWVSDGTPGSERRVRDLCPGGCSSSAGPVEEVGGRLLFQLYFPDDPSRTELWQTDGTRDGTVRVKALCSDGCVASTNLTPAGERALFLVVHAAGGLELWVTDGSADGTRPLREDGPDLSLSGGHASLLPGDGFAWIWADDGLWRSDGTAAGTVRLKSTEELSALPGGVHTLVRTERWQGLLFAFLSEGEIVRSDGTPEGTFTIATLPNAYALGGIAPLDGELLFQVDDLAGQSLLWSSRGTAETTGSRFSLGSSRSVSTLTALRGAGSRRAVFLRLPDEDRDKAQIWVTDGSAAGTRQVVSPGGVLHNGSFFATGDGRAFFLRGAAQEDLWITDGSEAGTHRVRSLLDVAGGSGPVEQAALGENLIFSALAPNGSVPLFVSDGSAAGTGLLRRDAEFAASFFRFGDRLLFSASRPGGYQPGLWATDGTPGGTRRLAPNGFSHPALLGGQILFAGLSGFGVELMRTDGLTRAVRLVKDIDPFIVDSGVHHLCAGESSFPIPGAVVGGRLLFSASDGRSGDELWASDGTPAGTVLVRDIRPGRISGAPEPCDDLPAGPRRSDLGLSSTPSSFVLLGSVALFVADDGLRGRELWITNGTSPGTHRVADLLPGPRSSAPHDLARLGNRVYFLASNPGPGESLWTTDGTAQGTTRVLDLTLDGLPSWGRGLMVAAGRLFFTVYNETTGAELWASTGVPGETGLVVDLNPGPGNSAPQFLTAVGGALVFAADDGLTGLEAWRSDGTAAGTVRVGDIAPGRDASSPGPFTVLPALVMTGADDGVHGRELWAIPRADIAQEP
jgi:large repetitive protein